MKNKMDLAFHIAVGSGIQIALFVAPVLVFASMAMNEQPLDLHFTLLEILAVVMAVGVLALVSQDVMLFDDTVQNNIAYGPEPDN